VCPEGEVANAAAADGAGTVLVASTSSRRPIEEIAVAAGALWLQSYLFPERARTVAMVRRAEAAGCRAIVLTVDAPRWRRKERSLRSEDQVDWPVLGNLAGLSSTSVEPAAGAPATWADSGRSPACRSC